MLFVIRFVDKPSHISVREQYLGEHLAWLAERKDAILVAGSLRHSPDQPAVGACWIVEADSKEAAENIYQCDPFWVNGLRASVEVLHWSKATDDRVLV